MRKKVFVTAIATALLAGTALGCDDPGPSGPGEINRVEIIGAERTVEVGQSIHFEGRAATDQDIRVDELVTWSDSPSGVINVNAQFVTVAGITVNRATVTGVAAGAADLTAHAGSKSHSIRITVIGSSTPQ